MNSQKVWQLVALLCFASPLAAEEPICSCGHPCGVVLENQILSGVETYEACLSITAGNACVAEFPSWITFRVGEMILLANGFEVEWDAELTLEIDPAMACDPSADEDGDFFDGCVDCDDGDPEVFPGADEICDSIDNDCDPASADGSDDPQTGAPCDGPDSDLCEEGTLSCTAGAFVCDDATGSSIDLCDGADNDCDPASPDGSEDPQNGAPCDGPDSDLCEEGTLSCTAGAFVCDDNTGDNVEQCNGLDDDCDSQIDEDFNSDDNPWCSSYTNLPSVSGDTGSDFRQTSDWSEAWYRVEITEDSDSYDELSASVALYSPAGVDFDLYVYCETCGGSLAGSSQQPSVHWDTVDVRTNDTHFVNDDYFILIEIRHNSSSICAPWTLRVYGNTTVATETCN